MIKENKVSKYFLYAIGEIILVVIGILIALSINTSNENNKNKREASFQLSKLRGNLNSDKTQLIAEISSDSLFIDNLIFCVKVLSDEIDAPLDEFLDNFYYLSELVDFNPTRGTFDGLISSGKIELINNHNLLDTLFSYYNANEYKGWDSSLEDYSRNVIIPYLLGFDHISNGSLNEGIDYMQFDISKFNVPSKSLDDYKNDLFLLNGLRFKIQIFEGQKAAYTELLKVIESLIISIDIELKK
ncbi:MAG: hypothetical protein COB12_01740 [Flavobacterium sp.]|nr:MAG: hypothetical protein COB12_01740 [Flavobacterium sp.]